VTTAYFLTETKFYSNLYVHIWEVVSSLTITINLVHTLLQVTMLGDISAAMGAKVLHRKHGTYVHLKTDLAVLTGLTKCHQPPTNALSGTAFSGVPSSKTPSTSTTFNCAAQWVHGLVCPTIHYGNTTCVTTCCMFALKAAPAVESGFLNKQFTDIALEATTKSPTPHKPHTNSNALLP
jgi:hypothetical protein